MQPTPSATGTLFVVATPIGNLGDCSSRMLATLQECDRIACEDTRVTGKLLAHLGVHKPMVSYRDDNEARTAEWLCQQLLSGERIALLTDAGTPGISDPGFRITRLCHRHQIPVVPIPGPCALITALCAAGLPTDSFLFLGFLLPKTAARRRIFGEYLNFPHTVIFYESPYRIEKCLDDMLAVYGPDRCVSVSKELTKMHERLVTGLLGSVREAILARSTKGEFVIAVAPQGYVL